MVVAPKSLGILVVVASQLRLGCNHCTANRRCCKDFMLTSSHYNRILRALLALPMVQYEVLGLASKYGIYTASYSIASVKTAIWTCFAS